MTRILDILFGLAAAVCVGGASLSTAGAAITGGAEQTRKPEGSSTQGVAQVDEAALRMIFETSCSGCHEIGDVTSQRKDLPGWTATVEKMVGYGAPVASDDQALIIEYLAKNYSS